MEEDSTDSLKHNLSSPDEFSSAGSDQEPGNLEELPPHFYNDQWLCYGALSVPIAIFLAIVYGYFFAQLCNSYKMPQLVKVINGGLSMQVLMLGGVLFAYFTFRSPGSAFSEDFLFKKWRFLYCFEGFGLAMFLFIPLLIIGAVSYFILEFLKKNLGPEWSQLFDLYPNIQEYLLKMDWVGFGVVAVIAVFVAPVVEEIVFRRVLFGYLKRKVNMVLAVIITSVFFAMIHMNLVGFFTLFVLGVIFQSLVIFHKSLFPAIFYHSAHNFLSMLVLCIVKYFELPINIVK